MKKSLLAEIVCYAFILLFVYAAASKLLDYENFRVQLGQSPLLTAYAGMVSWLVPAIEITIAAMLAFERSRVAGLYAAFTLMVIFSAYIITITRFSDYVPCSCGGILQKMGWGSHLAFNIIFTVLAAAALVHHFYCNKKPAEAEKLVK
jgi:methylamine utilization protein MauE